MLERLSLDGHVVIVTGGGTGLGRAMVMALARAGAELVIAARKQAPIDEAVAEVEAMGGKALAIITDVSDSGQVDRMVAGTLERFGKVDVLINNAGRTSGNVPTPIWDVSDEEWQAGIETNLSGAFYCARGGIQTHGGPGQREDRQRGFRAGDEGDQGPVRLCLR